MAESFGSKTVTRVSYRGEGRFPLTR